LVLVEEFILQQGKGLTTMNTGPINSENPLVDHPKHSEKRPGDGRAGSSQGQG
jgi:hypothetical protein